MRRIARTSSLLVFLDELEFTEAALGCWEETTPLVPLYSKAIDAFEGVFREERQARRGVTRAEAQVSARNGRLDGLTTRFGGLLLVEAGLDRSSALFRRFFADVPSVFVRRPLREQAERTLGVMLAELEKLDEKSPLRAFVAPLRAAGEQAIASLDARTEAKASRAITSSAVDDWKEGVNTLRLSTYAELLRIAVDQGYGKDWPELFFRAHSRGRKPAEDEPELDDALAEADA